MKKVFTELERLDTAARAEVAEASFYANGWFVGALALLSVILAALMQAPFYAVLYLRILAAAATFTALLIWSRWRYSLHAGGIVLLAFGFARVAWDWEHHSSSMWDWVFRVLLFVAYASSGFSLIKLGTPFASVHRSGWDKERACVQVWLKTLTNLAAETQVFEIPTGSFWTGYRTYRLMRSDGFWQVVTLKTGNYLRPRAYRILDADAVKMVKLPNGRFYLQIGKRTLREVNIAPEMQTGLLSLTGAK
jgi:hypothetical protein